MSVRFWPLASFGPLLVLTACAPSGTEPDPPPGGATWAAAAPATFGGIAVDADRYYVGAFTHELLAIDRKSKKVAWRAPTSSAGARFLSAGVVLAAGAVIVGEGDLFGFDPATGARKWRFTPYDGGFAPGVYGLATDGQMVFAGSASGDVYAVDAASGVQRWRAHLSDRPQTSVVDPVVSDGVVYVGYKHFSATPFRGGVAAIDAATGAVRWNRALDALRLEYGSGTTSRLALAGEVVVAGNEDGRVIALAKADGAVRWASERLPEVGGLNDTRPVVAVGGLIIAGSTPGFLCAYDLATGALRWKVYPNVGGIVLTMSADAQRVYVPDLTGSLLAVDALTGATRWLRGRQPIWSNGAVLASSPCGRGHVGGTGREGRVRNADAMIRGNAQGRAIANIGHGVAVDRHFGITTSPSEPSS